MESVPEAIGTVVSLDGTLQKPGYEATLRMRYFGEDASARAQASTALERAAYGEPGHANAHLTRHPDILNLNTDDLEYYHGSQTPTDT